MDTRFWGPGAWNLLHTITFDDKYDAATQQKLFELLPYVLPCKFCRASLTDYYEKEPLPDFTDRIAVQKWLYRIHNLVNGKLRGQGLITTRNPSFDDIVRIYTLKNNDEFPAWDFLYSIAYNHPLRTKGTPMPGVEEAQSELQRDSELNRWNILPSHKRFKYWCDFWKVLPNALPSNWKHKWETAATNPTCRIDPCSLKTRRASVSWIWNIRCKFNTTSRDPYREVCARLIDHSSGCSKSSRARTCRKKRR
jgi:hypothetical protein